MDATTCAPLIDPNFARVLAVLAFVMAFWCGVEFCVAMGGDVDDASRPGPNERRR